MDTQTQELLRSDELTQTHELALEENPSPEETPQVSEPKTSKPRFSKTLSFKLLLLFVALSTCVILVLDLAFTAFSYRAALDDVDQELKDNATHVVDRFIRDAIVPVNSSTEQQALLFPFPDHYIHVHFLTDPFPNSSEDDADTADE
ncbi:MAG: hypothetical protein IKS49_01095, partial [Actinomycetaceae bacterium]|nr:hypothetical protein [Actinomycetaceae bacterium]